VKGGQSKMKKILIALAVVMLSSTSAVWAYPVFENNTDNSIFFENAENWVDMQAAGVAGHGEVSEGDYFYGIVNSNGGVKANGVQIWAPDNVAPGPYDSFSGYFLTSVTGTTAVGGGLYKIDVGTYTGGSDPFGVITDAEIGSGVSMKLYTDTTSGYETNGGVADDIAKATDGSLWGSLSTVGGYWYTIAPILPPTIVGTGVGDSFGGLNFVGGTPFPLALVNDPNENIHNSDVEYYFNSEIEVNSGATWGFLSNDPAVIHPVPEPASMILFGSGFMVEGAEGIISPLSSTSSTRLS